MSFIQHSIGIIYNTIEDMLNDTKLKPGMVVEVMGYHEQNDSAAGYFEIKDYDDMRDVDYGRVFNTINHYQALRVIDSEDISVKLYGAYGDGTHDDTDAIISCINHNDVITFGYKETYKISDTIKINRSNITINFNDATLLCNGNMMRLFEIDQSEKTYDIISELYDITPVIIKNLNITLKNGIEYNDGVIYLEKLFSDVLLDTIKIESLTNGVGIIVSDKLRNDIYDGETRIDITKTSIICKDTSFRRTNVGMDIRRDNVFVTDDIKITNIYIGIKNGKDADTVFDDVELKFNSQPRIVDIHIDVNNKDDGDLFNNVHCTGILNEAKNPMFSNITCFNYWCFLYMDTTAENPPVVNCDYINFCYDSKYKVENSYFVYYKDLMTDSESISINVKNSTLIGANNSKNNFINIGNSLHYSYINNITKNINNCPLDEMYKNIISVRSADNEKISDRYNNVKVEQTTVGTVMVRPYNRITNYFRTLNIDHGIGAYINNIWTPETEVSFTPPSKIFPDKLIHTHNGYDGQAFYFRIYSDQTADTTESTKYQLENKYPQLKIGEKYYLCFDLLNTYNKYNLIITFAYNKYINQNNKELIHIPFLSKTIDMSSTESQHIEVPFTLTEELIERYINDSLTENYTCNLSYVHFELVTITSKKTDKPTVTDEISNLFFTRVNEYNMIQYYNESLDSMVTSVFRPYIKNSKSTPQGYYDYGISFKDVKGDKQIKIMSVPWISNIIPYNTIIEKNNMYYGKNNIFDIENYPWYNTILVIPQENGFSILRNLNVDVDEYTNCEIIIPLIEFGNHWYRKMTTFYFNADVITNGLYDGEGDIQVYIDDNLVSTYSTNNLNEKTITIPIGYHSLKIMIVYASEEDNNIGLSLSVRNFYMTESANEKIFTISCEYGKYYDIPLYKNGFLAVTPVEDINVGLDSSSETDYEDKLLSYSVLSYDKGRGQVNVTYPASDARVTEYLNTIIYPTDIIVHVNGDDENTNTKLINISIDDIDNVSITVSFLPENTSETDVIYSSDDESICTIDSGNITAHKIGRCNIDITTSNNITKSILVNVYRPIKSVSIQSPLTYDSVYHKYTTGQIEYYIDPPDTTDKWYSRWSSTNEDVLVGDIETGSDGSNYWPGHVTDDGKNVVDFKAEYEGLTYLNGVIYAPRLYQIGDEIYESDYEIYRLTSKEITVDIPSQGLVVSLYKINDIKWESLSSIIYPVGTVLTVEYYYKPLDTTIQRDMEFTSSDESVIQFVENLGLDNKLYGYVKFKIVGPGQNVKMIVTNKYNGDTSYIMASGCIPLTDFTINSVTNDTIQYGGAIQFSITPVPADASEFGYSMYWMSNQQDILTPTNIHEGIYNASNVGDVTIQARSMSNYQVVDPDTEIYDGYFESITKSYNIHVESSVDGIILNKSTLKFNERNVSDSSLQVIFQPYNATNINDYTISWSSSNTHVATVTSKGVVTSVNSGNCQIIATTGMYSAACTVNVVMEDSNYLSNIFDQEVLSTNMEVIDTNTDISIVFAADYLYSDMYGYSNADHGASINNAANIMEISKSLNPKMILIGGNLVFDIGSSIPPQSLSAFKGLTHNMTTVLNKSTQTINYLIGDRDYNDAYYINGTGDYNNVLSPAQRNDPTMTPNKEDVDNLGYYYKDITISSVSNTGVRVICLNSHDNYAVTSNYYNKFNSLNKDSYGFTNSQVKWFINTLASTPTTYSVLVCSHVGLIAEVQPFVDGLNTKIYDQTPANANLIYGILKAWKNKSTFSGSTETGRDSFFSSTVSVDYTSTAPTVTHRVVGIISAGTMFDFHIKKDNIHHITTACALASFPIDSDMNSLASRVSLCEREDLNCQCTGEYPYNRAYNTCNQDAFDVICINDLKSELKLVRFGAGRSRSYTFN